MSKAAKKINELLSDDDYNTHDDMMITGIRNLLEIIPKYKFNGLVKESQVGCSYANSVLSPIFNNPDKRRHLQW
jgi:ubiquinone biosynthesis protein COQ9